MKKRIWLALLPITLLWCGCSEDDPDHTREITAVASTYDVSVTQSTRVPITDTSFGGKAARVLAKETSKVYSQPLWCNGTMTFNDGTAAKYGNTTTGSKTDFPESDKVVYLCGLYPADGWKCTDDTDISAGTAIASGVVKYTLDGKTDIMWAASDQATPDKAAALNFNHLLTRLNIKLTKDVTYDVFVKDIKLIKTAGDKLYTVCSVDLNESTVEAAVSFSSGDGSTKELPCFPTGSDASFPTDGIDVPSINETDAYILAPSLTADEVSTNEDDYTLRVDYSIGSDKTELQEKVPVKLKHTGGADYDEATVGRTFEIELCFTLKNVRATATIEPWDDKYDPKVEAPLKPYIPELSGEGAEEDMDTDDGMVNCYMVKPNDKLAFPVKRAYKYVGEPEGIKVWEDNLRTTGDEYTDGFEVTVLWEQNDVIKGDPKVYGKGQDAVVELETNANITGNAVVALKRTDTQDIVWSYHIWVTNYDPETINWYFYNNSNKYCRMFDVDLGDEIEGGYIDGYGLVYQWGRKDPFDMLGVTGTDRANWPKTSQTTNQDCYTLKYVTEHPTTFITSSTNCFLIYDDANNIPWSSYGKKSLTDPCPVGSKVLEWPGTTSPSGNLVNNNQYWSSMTDNTTILITNKTWRWGAKYYVKYDGTAPAHTFAQTGFTFCWTMNRAMPPNNGWTGTVSPGAWNILNSQSYVNARTLYLMNEWKDMGATGVRCAYHE